MSSAIPNYGETPRSDEEAATQPSIAYARADGSDGDERQALLEDVAATSRDAQHAVGELGERANVKHRAQEQMHAGEETLARRADQAWDQLAPARRRLVDAAGQARQHRTSVVVGAGVAGVAVGALVWSVARRR
jgi:hypothetical protein